ncbi:MAG: response regulator [Saprospiraceae bacterium]|nr:response regulator [Saprospiraceae bacterium]
MEKDGISGHEFNRISHYQGKDGRLYFGGINGLTTFHPKDIAKEHATASQPLVITEFQQYDGGQNKLVERTAGLRDSRKITMLPSDRYFRIAFALLEYINLENVQYGYRIEGIDKEWTFQKENSIQLSRLPYGKHTLRVKGQGADGQWSTNELTIAVEVLKPFYLQTWFIALAIFSLLPGAFLFYKTRTRQLKERQRELEKIVAERTRKIQQDKAVIEKQAAELQSLEKLKSRFFANVSHELRTPLSLMIGPLDSILKKESNRTEKEQRMLEFVRNNSQHLLKLVNEILDLSKLETGRMEVKEEAVNFHDFLQPIMSQFSSFGDSESVKMQFDYQADPSLNLMLDANKFEKIVHNFLSNAIKFSPSGAVVKLKVEATDGHLLVSVTDQGPGIHPDDLPHIFDRFYQSKLLEAPAQGGTGIGLSLAAELAELLGGKIWAESPDPKSGGKGSVFYFWFPVKTADGGRQTVDGGGGIKSNETEILENVSTDTVAKNELTPVAPSTVRRMPSTVLIVEDNPELRSYMQLLLEDEYHVITAENGKVGWEILTMDGGRWTADGKTQQGGNRPPSAVHRPPDLIISDLMMPIMDGFQLLEKIKSHETLRQLPVIMLTARADVRVKLRALRIGVDDYLTKPFVEEELQVRIKNLLHNYRERVKALAEKDQGEEPLLPEKTDMAAADTKWLEQVEIVFSKILSDSQFKIDWVAGQMHLSERQFSRRLKQLTGLTPNNYLREMRLQRAKDFLHDGKYASVKEVGSAVGFSDTKYFSSLFQARFGVLPSAYLS